MNFLVDNNFSVSLNLVIDLFVIFAVDNVLVMVNEFISKLLLIHKGFEQCQKKYSKFISHNADRTEAQDAFQRALRKEGKRIESMVRIDIFNAVEDFYTANPNATADDLEGRLIDELRESYNNFLSIDHEWLNFPQGWEDNKRNKYFSEFYHCMVDELDAIKDNISGRMYLSVAVYVRDKQRESAQ